MALNDPNGKFILDLNNETFKENCLGLQKPDCADAMESFEKATPANLVTGLCRHMTGQVRDQAKSRI